MTYRDGFHTEVFDLLNSNPNIGKIFQDQENNTISFVLKIKKNIYINKKILCLVIILFCVYNNVF